MDNKRLMDRGMVFRCYVTFCVSKKSVTLSLVVGHTGCPTKHDPHGFCLSSLTTNMLESWDIVHWKCEIQSSSGVQKRFCTIFMSRDISKLKWSIRFQNV